MSIIQETKTANGSFSSLSISGNRSKSGNMSWSNPTLPDGATIISTQLTATLTVSMVIGSCTVTINGDYYSSSESLSYSLGTTLRTSMSVSAKGRNIFSLGTVSISNIVYSITYEYDDGTEPKPTITIQSVDRPKISDESGMNECLCQFVSDVNLTQWEARATYGGVTPGHGVGLLVESGGALAANEVGVVSVLDSELTNGEGQYTISIFGQNKNGAWSDD